MRIGSNNISAVNMNFRPMTLTSVQGAFRLAESAQAVSSRSTDNVYGWPNIYNRRQIPEGGKSMANYRNVLVAVDFSEESKAVVKGV